MEGLFLGLATGTACLAYCAPVLIPYLIGEGKGIRQNSLMLVVFLIGRLYGYLLFAVLAWLAGLLIGQGIIYRDLIFGGTYLVLALLLMIYGFSTSERYCPAKISSSLSEKFARLWPSLLPLVLGFFTGLNLCPPFFLAIAGAAKTGTLAGSLWFFLLFFFGTTLYFVPVPLLGIFRKFQQLKMVARLAAGTVGLYYAYIGVIMIFGGVKRL